MNINTVSKNIYSSVQMPENCGMKGMHENAAAIKQNPVKRQQPVKALAQTSMPENCGMKDMHEKGTIIDRRV